MSRRCSAARHVPASRRLGVPAQPFHAQAFGGVERGVERGATAIGVAGLHLEPATPVLSPCQERRRTETRLHGEGGLEVALGVVRPPGQPGQHAEEPVDGTLAALTHPADDDLALVGQQVLIKAVRRRGCVRAPLPTSTR